MNFQSGFDKLPVELCCLIADLIDKSSLAVLSVLSKRNYATFLPLLYRTVESCNLSTLALSQKSRGPLKGQHFASFVKEIDIEFEIIDFDEEEQMRRELKRFRRDLGRAMANIIEQSPNGNSPGLRSFRFVCELLSFPEAFGKVDFSVFRSLKRVYIACEFPKANIKKCLSMMNAICVSSLTSLYLGLAFLEDVPPLEPRHFARVLKQIGDTCPNLTELGIDIPDAEENSVQSVNDVVNSLHFPDLRYLHLNYGGCFEGPGGRELEWGQFLRNHPNVQRFDSNSPYLIPDDALARIASYSGTFEYRSVLFNLTDRALTSICLELRFAASILEWNELANCLVQIPTLRRLVLEESYWDDRWPYHGLGPAGLICISNACPNLTSLECGIGILSVRNACETLAIKLPRLEHLQLTIYRTALRKLFADYTDDTRCMKEMADSVAQSINFLSQRDLRTVVLDVFGWRCCFNCQERFDWNGVLYFDMTTTSDGRRELCYVPEESFHV